ncbi:MAG: YeeE/YedE family protein, partial [Proteobacteria bacterium]|nr:YeeE/YedE family protein [Pseudomonadota bacterium]
WAIMGFCPGTSLGALGEGRWHAVFAIIGMVVGAAFYAELYPFLKSTVLAWKDFGKLGLPEALGISQWVIVPIFWVGIITLFFWFEKKKL